MRISHNSTLDRRAQLLDESIEQNYASIQVWPFDKAPPSLQKMSEHGGDEDGIVWIPQKYLRNMEEDQCYGPIWLESLWSGYGDQQVIAFKNGVLIIWAHA